MLEYRDRYVEQILGIGESEYTGNTVNTDYLRACEDDEREGERKAPYVAVGLFIGAVLFVPAMLLGLKLIATGLLGASMLISALIGSSA